MTQLLTRLATLQAQQQETLTLARNAGSDGERAQKALEEVLAAIQSCERRLEEVEPEFLERSQLVRSHQEQIARAHSAMEGLYGRLGRGSQFSTRKERDK